ncbi:MAG: extracellular solute-binding protein [Deltaproteobacteria bacterium]|nr:extracellular solute-binding protein [Deltaproteobacteria bacterium]MBM4298698.1 extracellular solute-binding protein [Deltaproteobacteria bacterium]
MLMMFTNGSRWGGLALAGFFILGGNLQAAEKAAPKAAPAKSLASEVAAAEAAYQKVAKELYPLAQKEGNLIIYSVWDVEHLKTIGEAFSKRFPGIKVTYWQARNPEIVTRVLTEFQGGQASVDTILSDNAPAVLRAAGAMTNYETVQKNILVLHDPTMPTVSLQIQALTFNTKKLKAADAPKSWEDVANPKFKGMVALDDPMRAGPLSSMLAGLREQWKNETRFNNFLKGLKGLGVPVHKSTSAMFRLVIAGEYAICMPALLHDVIEEIGKGTPIDYVRTVGPVVFPRQAGIYAKAPNLNAAKLFAEWAISQEGQKVIDGIGRESSRKDFKSKTAVESAFPKGTSTVPVNDKLFLENPKQWLDTFVKPIWEG